MDLEQDPPQGWTSWRVGGWAVLLLLFAISIYLAVNRIYQVDEVQHVFTSRFLGRGEADRYLSNAPLFLLGPLSWMAASLQASTSIFVAERLVFLCIFWINWYLLTSNSGLSLRKPEGLLLAVALATLAPWWDYGFEIRHDNLLLTGILAIWWLARRGERWGLLRYGCIGLIAAVMQFIAFKAFLFWAPLLAGLVFLPNPSFQHQKFRLLLAAATGAVGGALLVYGLYRATGLWNVYLHGFAGGVHASKTAERFSPWLSLSRPFKQAPFFMALLGVFTWESVRQMRKMGRSFFSWESYFPEFALVAGCLLVLLLNPTPFPYNLVLVVPFVGMAGARLCLDVWDGHGSILKQHPLLLAVTASMAVFTHGVPFTYSLQRHFEMSNDRQELLMDTAEAMTDPVKDRVYDAAGLVPTRESIGYYWFLHSLNINQFLDGTLPSVQRMLQQNPPSVFIPNYRTNWLKESDGAYIREHYLPLADDFWVLGATLPAGGGSWNCIHGGRFLVLVQQNGSFSSPSQWKADGREVRPEEAHEFTLGTHEISLPAGESGVVVWLGPQLRQLPALPPGDHNRLFVNWY